MSGTYARDCCFQGGSPEPKRESSSLYIPQVICSIHYAGSSVLSFSHEFSLPTISISMHVGTCLLVNGYTGTAVDESPDGYSPLTKNNSDHQKITTTAVVLTYYVNRSMISSVMNPSKNFCLRAPLKKITFSVQS